MRRLLPALLCAGLSLTACTSSLRTSAAPATSSAPAASPAAGATPLPTPSAPVPAATAATDPLTGLPRRPAGRLVVVKIDNERLAQPFQTGIDRASLVYEELMEGGSTRLLAVYESALAGDGEVGPVRSLRESDIDLLRELGRPAVAFSGANRGVRTTFAAAVARGYALDASYDALAADYRRGSRRPDAYNFFVRPQRLAAAVPAAGAPRDIGLRFGPAPAGPATLHAVASFSPDWSVDVRYDPAGRTYEVRQNGRRTTGAAPRNVVVQVVGERGSRYRDVLGSPTPYTVTTGGGRAVVLRDGRRVEGRWVRTGYGPTHFLDAAGHDVPLLPGQTWVLLLPAGRPLALG